MRPLVFLSVLLIGCYAPDYTQKACVDNFGCPNGYSCKDGFCGTLAPTLSRCQEDTSCGAGQKCRNGVCLSLPKDVRVDPPAAALLVGYSLQDMNTVNDYPAHYRTISASYYLDDREVTVERYQECVDAGGCLPIHIDMDNKDCNGGKPERLKHPVNCVDLKRAESYCVFIGRRLPTETEWEYAARGDSSANLYPWGRDFIEANACWNQPSSCEAGSKVRTYLGAEVTGDVAGFYDLAGNVWEWTSSEFCPYNTVMKEGMGCMSDAHVIRGGAAFQTSSPNFLRSTARLGNLTTDTGPSTTAGKSGWHPNLGFRCARDAN